MSERLGVLAHELRSPVAALAALAERARGAPLSAATLARMVALALQAGRDVERLLADPELLSVEPVAARLADVLEGLDRPGVELAVEDVQLECDPTRVRQAVANLVANGLRHGERVTVEARRTGDTATITVADDGPGVDPRIDPFARGVSTAGSTGYGLWLARGVAEAHGGRLELLPAAAGAVFTLVLPLAFGAPV